MTGVKCPNPAAVHSGVDVYGLVDHVVSRCTEVDTGARNIDHILSRTMLPEISTRALGQMAEGNPIKSIFVSTTDKGEFEYQIA